MRKEDEPTKEQLMGEKPMPGTIAYASQELGEACKKLGRECEKVLPYWLRPTVIVEFLDDIIGRDPKK